ncbi:MAG TPA: PQQ-binding-like beta-propeller repeat protein, partial [Pirellulaceae bacterium]|nr:PQQ-binding-like beta-propeller repeat protein [Pirellulaceae bacterium]
MSATKVLDMAEKQGLLDGKVIGELRTQVAESKFVVTAEAIAKILVDHGHLTAFQARKLVATALGEPEPVAPIATTPDKSSPPPPKPHESELGLADSSSHDDIVDMKVAAPPSKPPAAKPPPPKPPSRSQAETRPLDIAPRPVPPRSAPSPQVPVSSPAPSVLEPIAAPAAVSPLTPVAPPRPAPPPPASPRQPVDPLALDPLQAPSGTPTSADQRSTKARTPARPRGENPWKNPTYLLLGGGGLLVMFVVFSLLLWFLVRTPVAELFSAAAEDYESGSLGGAKEKYTEFLKRTDPKSDDAGLARVRLGMIDLRQASAEGRNPKPGIEAANRILPELLKEAQFDACRLELRSILVSMALTSARGAQAAKTTEKKEELVVQTEEAFKLVDNASYIPSSTRGDVQPQINQAIDILKAARRSIDQDKDLAKAVAAMKEATEAKDAAQAYQVRTDLLRTYPALDADAALLEATATVAAMEKGLVKLQEESLSPLTQDEPPPTPQVVLSHTTGSESGLAGQYVATLVQGAVYGFDANLGKLLWRRYVGHDTNIWPQPVSGEAGADFLLVDGMRHELIRVKAASGEVVWRLALGQRFTPPVVSSEQVYLNTADGRLVEVNLATGQSQRQLKLPQSPSVSPAYDAREFKLFQLGKHSSLFVLDADRFTCTETYYLGHKAGAILVPPVTVLGHVLVTESPSDDYSLIHTLAFDAETKKLKSVADPIRLKGRVVVPLQVDRNLAVVVTDQGQVKVIQVEPAIKERPIREMATGSAGGRSQGMTYFALAPGQVFVTSDRVSCLEIQAAAGDLKSMRQLHGGDAFVAPPQVMGKVLIHVRRPKSSLAITVEAYRPEDNKSLWKTEIAAPLAALAYDQGRQQLAAITSRGRVYELPESALQGGKIDKANYVPIPGTESMSLTDAVELGGGKLVLLGPQAGPHGLLYDPNSSGNRAQQIKFAIDIGDASAPATFFQGGLALPQQTGQVMLLDPSGSGHKAQPFQPALVAGQRIAWNRPALIPPDGTDLAVADGQRTIYRLSIRPQPQPHLQLLGETVVANDIVAPLAASGDTLYAVLRTASTDQVVALQGSDLTNVGKLPLAGRVRFGPVSSGGLVFIADEKNLLALESGTQPRWSQPLAHGLPARAPLKVDADWIVIFQDGTVSRLSADSGQELAAATIGEHAGSAAA